MSIRREYTVSRKDEIIERLKENGCRITRQRRILIDIILENDCDQCAGRDRRDQPEEYVPGRMRGRLYRPERMRDHSGG